MNDKNKYKCMENVLQEVNSKCVALDNEEVARNNVILKQILPQIVDQMIQKDDMFKKLYSTIFYGGSFYDGIRVGSAVEFDLDLLLLLPKNCKPVVTPSNINGFVHVQLQDLMKYLTLDEAKNCK